MRILWKTIGLIWVCIAVYIELTGYTPNTLAIGLAYFTGGILMMDRA